MRVQQGLRTRASAELLEHLYQRPFRQLSLDVEAISLELADAGLRRGHTHPCVVGAAVTSGEDLALLAVLRE